LIVSVIYVDIALSGCLYM